MSETILEVRGLHKQFVIHAISRRVPGSSPAGTVAGGGWTVSGSTAPAPAQ